MIQERKIDVLIAETTTWKQLIQELENENIFFKTRLATVLSTGRHGLPIEQFEHFQNRFLKMDSQLTVLRHEVREQLKQLESAAQSHETAEVLSVLLQEQLGKRMTVLESSFEILLHDFSMYLSENFPGS
ncbi:hypothetical protein [uncultured Chitinophaga sp.]|uniref:hypothetical protein n=1 Tax=uncultured Chitinophaga sp. TaxID=339340 RepID=UPI0025E66CD7|nr:hypothetical protein [uncultured Chitinophaga sp.]